MRNTIKHCLLCLLCLLLALTLAVSCSDNREPDPIGTTADTTVTSAPQESAFLLSVDAYVTVSEKSANSPEIRQAISLFGDACKAYFGRSMKTTDDWYRGEMVRNKIEILIGETNRPESIAVAESLTYYDYGYEVLSSGVVVICGGSDTATLTAVQRFLKDCYGFVDETNAGELCEIPTGTSYSYRHKYDFNNILLDGKPIDSFSIVHRISTADKRSAQSLSTSFERLCGISIPTVSIKDYKGGNAILLGMGATDGSHLSTVLGNASYGIKLATSGTDTLLILDSTMSVDNIAAAFSAEFLSPEGTAGTLELTFSDKLKVCSGYYAISNQLKPSADPLVETIADGVIYRKLSYKDKDGKPVNAFVIEADLSKVDVVNATPNNGEAITNVKATTKKAMQALATAGYTVYAGINADFFRINSDYSPQGLCIKNGKILSNDNGRPFFAITKDGKPVIGEPGEGGTVYNGQLLEAVGGSNIFLKGGVFHDVGYNPATYGDDFASIRHPRTAVGITEDGRLIMLVVDGRSEKSNGASLIDLGQIMLAMGVTDAINLDGGGSSTMITFKNGSYQTKNTPSDGALRSVFNSLVLVKKTN